MVGEVRKNIKVKKLSSELQMKRSRLFIGRNKHYLNSGEQKESWMNIYIQTKVLTTFYKKNVKT